MGEYEPNDSRNVTGTASTQDGRWTGQAANDPTMTDAQRQAQQGGGAPQQQGGQQHGSQQQAGQQQGQQQGQQGQQGSQQGFAEPFTAQDAAQGGSGGQQQQAGQSVGQSGEGISGAGNQGNDHTSAIGQNQSAGAAGSGQASYGNSGQGMSQPQQFQDTTGQQGGGGNFGGAGAGAGQFAGQVAKHQEVVDAQGNHVGTVDHVDGDRIKLTRQDSADGEHHYVSLSEVAGIEGGRVRLSGSGSQGSGGPQ